MKACEFYSKNLILDFGFFYNRVRNLLVTFQVQHLLFVWNSRNYTSFLREICEKNGSPGNSAKLFHFLNASSSRELLNAILLENRYFWARYVSSYYTQVHGHEQQLWCLAFLWLKSWRCFAILCQTQQRASNKHFFDEEARALKTIRFWMSKFATNGLVWMRLKVGRDVKKEKWKNSVLKMASPRFTTMSPWISAINASLIVIGPLWTFPLTAWILYFLNNASMIRHSSVPHEHSLHQQLCRKHKWSIVFMMHT